MSATVAMWIYPHYLVLHCEGMVRKWELKLTALPVLEKSQMKIFFMVVTAAIAAVKAVAEANRIVYAIVLFAAARQARQARWVR
jgi:hypothetical protein